MFETAYNNLVTSLPFLIVGYGIYITVSGAAKIAVKHPKETMNGVRIVRALLKR